MMDLGQRPLVFKIEVAVDQCVSARVAIDRHLPRAFGATHRGDCHVPRT